MATLHGILAELGIELPDMHPEREIASGPEWTADQPFRPEVDASYEVVLGDAQRHARKTIRIDGPEPSDWYDLEAERRLDPELGALPVRAFRRLGD